MHHKNWRFDTRAVHGAEAMDPHTGSVAPPIYQTSTFYFKNADHGEALFKGEAEGYIYSRISNPTFAGVERHVADLEGAEASVSFASGLGAIAGLMLTLCQNGDNFVSSNAIYGGTHGQFQHYFKRMGIEAREVLATDVENIRRAIDDKTRLLFIETPANPNLAIIDIKACAQLAHEHGIPLAVDNTFATPVLQRPLELGADIIVHSATKYISGHGDVVAGFVAGDAALMKRVRDEALKPGGACISPFNAWLLMRGLKTLSLRMERHCANALKLATFLEHHPRISRVFYPGLKSNPGHELAKRQMPRGFGGMIAFDYHGTREDGKKLIDSLQIMTDAVSLGDCDTLVCHPASTTHASYTPEQLAAAQISPNMIRISVGVEDAQDLIEDLDQALAKIM